MRTLFVNPCAVSWLQNQEAEKRAPSVTTYKAKTRTKMLTAEQELNLLDRYLDDGDMMAREKLITSYLPMATAAAQQVARRGLCAHRLSDRVSEAPLPGGVPCRFDAHRRDPRPACPTTQALAHLGINEHFLTRKDPHGKIIWCLTVFPQIM